MSSSHCADPGPGAAEIGTASDYNFFKRTTRGDRMMVKKVLNNSLGSCCFFIFGVCIFTFNLFLRQPDPKDAQQSEKIVFIMKFPKTSRALYKFPHFKAISNLFFIGYRNCLSFTMIGEFVIE